MKGFTLFCFLLLVLLLMGFAFQASAAETNWPSARVPPRRTVEVGKHKIVAKNDKKPSREFPVMFDIADRSVKRRKGKK